ncbi:hypothetical protein [Kitasatospora sp. NPDC088134]|uniref:hypothetical protein n=1 Tax=Kitasatospora sp. NPDC088134 TaxID=3364071 RepID=UPI003822E0F1
MSVHLPGELEALRELLAEWTAWDEQVAVIAEDRGLDHGQLCWEVLAHGPNPLVGPTCRCRSRGWHSSPHSDRMMHERLGVRVPVADAEGWAAHTLGQDLVYGSFRSIGAARVLAAPLVELLGPDADWRANGYAAHPPPSGNRHWDPVTPYTFDAALVGIGGGWTVVLVSTGED